MSYYKIIYEVKHDDKLLQLSKDLVKGQGDGRISMEDVEQIKSHSKNGNDITSVEIDTLKHIYKNTKMSNGAKIKLLEYIVFKH